MELMESEGRYVVETNLPTNELDLDIAYFAYRLGAFPYALRATHDPVHWVTWDYSDENSEAGFVEGLEAIKALTAIATNKQPLLDAEKAMNSHRKFHKLHRESPKDEVGSPKSLDVKTRKEQATMDRRLESKVLGSFDSLPSDYQELARLGGAVGKIIMTIPNTLFNGPRDVIAHFLGDVKKLDLIIRSLSKRYKYFRGLAFGLEKENLNTCARPAIHCFEAQDLVRTIHREIVTRLGRAYAIKIPDDMVTEAQAQQIAVILGFNLTFSEITKAADQGKFAWRSIQFGRTKRMVSIAGFVHFLRTDQKVRRTPTAAEDEEPPEDDTEIEKRIAEAHKKKEADRHK